MTAYSKALEHEKPGSEVCGRAEKRQSYQSQRDPQDRRQRHRPNATTVMMEEMKLERKETAAQMKQLTAILIAAPTNTTPLPASTPPVADGVFYNPTATRRFRHPPPKNVQTSGLL